MSPKVVVAWPQPAEDRQELFKRICGDIGLGADETLLIWTGRGWKILPDEFDKAVPKDQQYVIVRLAKLESHGMLRNFGAAVSAMERNWLYHMPVPASNAANDKVQIFDEGPEVVSVSLGKRRRMYGVHCSLLVRGAGTLEDPLILP